MLDITMMATLRPEIVDQTLTSFVQNLFHTTEDKRLIINIDPVGDAISQKDVLAVAHKHFEDRVKVRCPKKACFPTALKWCWSQVEAPYFFNLEDDWQLLPQLDLAEMYAILDDCPWLAILRLPKGPAFHAYCKQSASHKQPYYVWNGRYFACPATQIQRSSYYGSPSLIRSAWLPEVLPLLHTRFSTEKQLLQQHKKRHPAMWLWEYGVYTKPSTPRTIVDIGTPWRHKRGIRKNSYDRFTTWLESSTGSPNS